MICAESHEKLSKFVKVTGLGLYGQNTVGPFFLDTVYKYLFMILVQEFKEKEAEVKWQLIMLLD